MRQPCDEVAIRAGLSGAPCRTASQPWILAAAILASSMAFIDSTVVNVALPAIQAGFHTSVVGVQWVVEAYGLFLSALILVGGSVGDLLGRRKIFLAGVVIFAITSMACGFSLSIQQLIIARGVQGVGAALLVPGSLSIISASFDEQARGQAIGTWSGFTTITTAIGPVLGGFLVEHASWRWAFFINLPLAAAVIAISLRHVPESRSASAKRIDWFGALFVTLSLAGLVTGFIESVDLGWKHPLVFLSLIGGFVCLLVTVFVETRVKSPIVPTELFSSRSFSGANLLTLLLYAAIGIFFFLFPLNLIQVQGYSPTVAGAAMLPLILLMFTLSHWSGGLVARYGPRGPLTIGPMVASSGFILFARASVGGRYWTTFFPALVILGFGMAVTVAPLTTVVMNSAGKDRVGAASGINNAVARVAGVLAIAVFGIVMANIFSSRLNRGLPKLSLPPAVVHEIQASEIKLAGLQVPTEVDSSTQKAIKNLVGEAFVSGFRVVILICGGLSLASAVVAYVWVDSPTQDTKVPSTNTAVTRRA